MNLRDFVYHTDTNIRVPGYTYFINKYGCYLDWDWTDEEFYLINLNDYLRVGEKIIFENYKTGQSTEETATILIKSLYKIHK